MAQVVDNITLLPDWYKEEEDTAVLKVSEQEIDEDFPEIIRVKVLLGKEKKKKEIHLCYY